MTPQSRDEARERLAAALVHRLVKFAKAVETASQRERIGLLLDHAHEAADAILALLSPEQGWRDVGEVKCGRPVLVSRAEDGMHFTPTTAFIDATGVWRVFRSEDGMEPLPFVPTHWQPIPAPPTKGGE